METFTLEKNLEIICSLNRSEFCYVYNQINSESDFYADFRTLPIKIMTGLNLGLRLTFGNFFALTLIHYEKFGGDPMKRSIINQIISLMCCCLLVNSLISQPLAAYSIIIGPISQFLAKFCLFDGGSFQGIVLLGLAEIVIIQNLMLFNLSFVSRFDESFFGKFIVMWNLGFVSGSYLATCYFGNLPKPPTEFLTGKIINGNFFYV